jgi:2-succinyl-6-hydroxy-2,4-cyclohexadiene-1-carboxylate synthase
MADPRDDLHFDVHGDGRKPYLLLVHGFLSSRAQWGPNLAALAEVSTPVTVELLGHGRSCAPADPSPYAVSAYVKAFEALRRRLGADHWLVCGQSFGAGLTLRYALEHPQRVIGSIFTNTVSALSPSPDGGGAAREARARELEGGGAGALKALPFYPRPSKRLPAQLWEALVADAERLSPKGVAQTIRFTAPDISVAADLSRLSGPLLLVNGVREAAFQPLRDRAAAEIADLRIVDVETGGHSVNIDSAVAFNTASVRFIEAVATEISPTRRP